MTPAYPECQGRTHKNLITIISFSLINLLMMQSSMGQEKIRNTGIGFSYGNGTQQVFPFGSEDYRYTTRNFKIIINYPLITGKIGLEMRIEPSIFSAKHKLLNEYFVQPEYGPDYLYLREVYTRQKTITMLASFFVNMMLLFSTWIWIQ